MLTGDELWRELERVVQSAGLELFDLDMPAQKSGTLRVYIAQPTGAGTGITLDVCEEVSKKITSDPRLAWITDRFALEVSSPGINRRLHRPEHFTGAVGERVKLVIAERGKADQTLVGKITKCEGTALELAIEGGEEVRCIALDDIHKARVDFFCLSEVITVWRLI